LDDAGVPVSLHCGCIDQLEINLPWNSLLDEDSVVSVRLKGIHILVRADYSVSAEKLESRLQKQKQMKLQKYENEKGLSGGSLWQSSTRYLNSYFESASTWMKENVLYRFLAKLEVVLEDIHVRFEDTSTTSSMYGIGIIIRGLYLQSNEKEAKASANTTDESVQLVHKVLELSRLSIYVDLLRSSTLEVSQRVLSISPTLPLPHIKQLLAQPSTSSSHRYLLESLSCTVSCTAAVDTISKSFEVVT
jgi:hypothetical protein